MKRCVLGRNKIASKVSKSKFDLEQHPNARARKEADLVSLREAETRPKKHILRKHEDVSKEFQIQANTGGRTMESLSRMADGEEMGQRFFHQESAAPVEPREVWRIFDRRPTDALQVALERWADAERAASSQTCRAPAADW